jgi:hypothetical protein
MKNFMVFYCGGATDEEKEALAKTDLQPKVKAWGEWMAKHSKDIVSNGGPIGKTVRVDSIGTLKSKNQVGAYVVVQAESYEAASAMFINHPHLSFFKSNWIEVMEILPSPK